jgi:hypothetical protein
MHFFVISSAAAVDANGLPPAFMTFSNMTVRRKSNTLLLHAMSWSRYKALLVLLKDSG